MTRPDELVSILDRILNDCGDEGDVAILRQSLKESSGQNVVQLGKYNVNIGEGQDIHIGDKVYQGADAQTIRSIFLEVLSQNTRQLEIDWHNISQAMLSEQQRLTTNPLTSGEGITYRTEQVYVPLGLVERKKPTRRRKDVSPEQGSELYRETEITQTFEHQQFLEQVLRHRQSPKSQGRRIAIIGEPGAGKTTLLQQIAQWVSLEMAQSVVIWVSLADLQGRELESYLLEVWLQAVARKVGQAEASTQVQDDFVAQFNQGLVWLLLDGVDEMQATVGNPLGEIERQIRTGTLLQQARIVLSCRLNLWDGGSNALDSFDNYRTLEFSYPQQVEQFIGNWFGSLRSAETQTGQRLSVALRESGKERIRDLVKNPLRLTLLCFNWYLSEGKLPETKAGLYEQFVADFYEWKKGLFATTGEQRKRLNTALGELAREAIDKEATRFRLRQEFVCEYLGEPDDADSLFGLALRLGWLNKVGVDGENPRKGVYGFFHPTFQEYFAALASDDWGFFIPKNHINCPIVDLNCQYNNYYRIFQLQWKEVILLWLGRNTVKNEEKEHFLTKLINFDDGCDYSLNNSIEKNEGFYERRAYFLALEGINEYEKFSQIERILEKIVLWSFGFIDEDSGQWLRQLKPFEDMSMAMLFQFNTEKVAPALVNLMKSTPQNTIIHGKAVEILKKIYPNHPESTYSLVDLMNKSEEPLLNQEIREKTIEVTLKIPTPFQKHCNNQASFTLHHHDIPRLKLNGMFATNELSRICLENLCQYSHDEGLRLLAAEYLSRIDLTSYTATSTLENLIYNSHDDYICKYAERILSTIEKKSLFETIPPILQEKNISIEEILLKIENAQREDERVYLLNSLLEIDPNNLQAINSLVQVVRDSKNELFRWKAAISLEKIALGNQNAITILESLLTDFGLKSSSKSQLFSKNLLEEFNNDIRSSMWVRIITNLWKIYPENSNAITALENLIRSSYKLDDIIEIAKVLEKIDIGNSTALEWLHEVKRSFFDTGSDGLDVINILLKFDSTKFKAIETLLKLVKTTQNINDAIFALDKLKSLMTSEHMPKVVNYLKPCLSDLICDSNLEKRLHDINFVRLLESYHEVIILCAQTLTYPDFYRAWHTQEN